jgi:regulation of enolase protein 1 (concanavalin A-like superfamily)
MKTRFFFSSLALAAAFPNMPSMAADGDGNALVSEKFTSPPAAPWKWVRENPKGWKTGPKGLEVLIEPGNMWGPANDAKNLLLRPAPDTGGAELEITATVTNQPTNQYEQVDLTWYYDDSHMVKIGLEKVDGKLCIVMGREEKDKTKTMSINPVKTNTVKLRLLVKGQDLRGQFQQEGSKDWQDAGSCTAPVPDGGRPNICLQFYQGDPAAAHWGLVSEFTVNKRPSAVDATGAAGSTKPQAPGTKEAPSPKPQSAR